MKQLTEEELEEERRRQRRGALYGVPGWAMPPWRIYSGYGPAGWVSQATPPVNPEQFGEGDGSGEAPPGEGSEGAGESGGGEL